MISENDRHDITAALGGDAEALYMPLARSLWEEYELLRKGLEIIANRTLPPAIWARTRRAWICTEGRTMLLGSHVGCSDGTLMNIGEEKETKVIEPLVEPIPNAQPVPAPGEPVDVLPPSSSPSPTCGGARMSRFPMVPDMIEPVVGWRVWRVDNRPGYGHELAHHELSWPSSR